MNTVSDFPSIPPSDNSTTQPVPSISTSTPPKKVFIILGIIIFFLLAATGTYFLGKSQNNEKTNSPSPSLPSTSPTLNPTSSWNTYTNIENNFSFQYPSDWYLTKTADGTIVLDFESFTNRTIVEPNQVEITLTIQNDDNSNIKDSSNKVTNPNGIEIYYILPPTPDPYLKVQNQVIWANINSANKRYFLGLRSNKYKDTFDQILSTFKFIDTNSSVEGKFCGGIAAMPCPSGFACKFDGNYPDAGGKCTAN